jgi:hypothetical protein
MSDKDDGGPAFPNTITVGPAGDEYHPADHGVSGLSIRDWFAGQALAGFIAGLYAGDNSGWTVDGNVTAAYEYADAMLAKRDK